MSYMEAVEEHRNAKHLFAKWLAYKDTLFASVYEAGYWEYKRLGAVKASLLGAHIRGTKCQ